MPGYLHDGMCDLIERALDSPAMAAPDSRLVVLSCFPGHPACLTTNRAIIHDKLAVVYQTACKMEGVAANNMGIPPLPIKPVVMNATEQEDIANCRVGNGMRPHPSSSRDVPVLLNSVTTLDRSMGLRVFMPTSEWITMNST